MHCRCRRAHDDKRIYHSALFGEHFKGGNFRGAVVFRWLLKYRTYRCAAPYLMVLTPEEEDKEAQRLENAELLRRAREKEAREAASEEVKIDPEEVQPPRSPQLARVPLPTVGASRRRWQMQAKVRLQRAAAKLPEGVTMVTRALLKAQPMPTPCAAGRDMRAARGRARPT